LFFSRSFETLNLVADASDFPDPRALAAATNNSGVIDLVQVCEIYQLITA
jgi:hypothetical protein